MQKVTRHMLAVAGRILFVGLSIQIVLGILWTCCNFGRFQEFGDSLFYIEVSKSFLCDEYTGALYPVFLMLVRGIEDLLHIPYTYVLHLIQLCSAGFAGMIMARALGAQNRVQELWGSLALLTFPMALQCHLAVLPNSLTFSCFLLEVALVIKNVKRPEIGITKFLKIHSLWLISALLMPDYLFLGAVPVVLLLLYDWIKNHKKGRKRLGLHLLSVVAFCVIIVSVGALTQEKGCYGRADKTLDAALFRRFAWTSLGEYFYEGPEELSGSISWELVTETAGYADNMERIFQPELEQKLGAERAGELYREYISYIWEENGRAILHETAWDAVSYSLPPTALKLLLTGRGYDSYAGRNYEVMRKEAPVLTKYYVEYSSWWFVMGIGLAVVAELCLILQRRKMRIFPMMLCAVSAMALVVWYTLSGAGVWDYKKALFAGAVWLVWMLSAIYRDLEEKKV